MIQSGLRKIAWCLAALVLIAALTLIGWRTGLAVFRTTPSEQTAPRDKEPEIDHLAEGKTYQQSGDIDTAIKEFTKAIQADPKDAPRYVYRGAAYLKKEQYAKAIQDLNQAIDLNPKDPEAWAQRGLAFAGLGPGFYQKTIDNLTEALRLSPQGPTAVPAHINRGFAYEQLGKQDKAFLDKALADYNEAHRIDPKSAIVLEYRAGIYVKQSKFQEALAELDEAVALQPGLAELRDNRGIIYQRLGRLDKAIEDFNEAIRLDPKYVPAYIDRGKAHKLKGETALAEADFKKARELQLKQRRP